MTAATADRKAPQYGSPDEVDPGLLSLPVAASTIIYAGTFVASDASGNAVPGSANVALKLWGRCEIQVDNSAGTAGAKRVQIREGVFAFNNSGAGVDQILAANVGQPCYAVDDNVVALTDGNGSRPFAGVIFPFDPNNTSQVQVGVGPAFAPAYGQPGGSSAFKARGAVFANVASLAAFTVAGNDGITYVAGDVVLLAAQTTAAQNGPYVVGTVTSGTAPLTRPAWWSTGSPIIPGQVIQLGGEGTIYGGSEWKALCAKSKIIDTDDPVFYPRVCKATVTLASGTYTLGATEGLFVKSTTRSIAVASRNTVGGTVTSTIMYALPVAGRTAGISGTGALQVNAVVAAGTTNAADTSTVDVLLQNW